MATSTIASTGPAQFSLGHISMHSPFLASEDLGRKVQTARSLI